MNAPDALPGVEALIPAGTTFVNAAAARVLPTILAYRPGRDYRASFPDDADHDDTDWEAGRRLAMPVLALWGETGLPSRVPVLDVWRDYAHDVRGAALPNCGHFLPEEQPELVLDQLRKFLAVE